MSNIFAGTNVVQENPKSGRSGGGHSYTVEVINGSVKTKQTFATPEGK
jgi:hypothetical protein